MTPYKDRIAFGDGGTTYLLRGVQSSLTVVEGQLTQKRSVFGAADTNRGTAYGILDVVFEYINSAPLKLIMQGRAPSVIQVDSSSGDETFTLENCVMSRREIYVRKPELVRCRVEIYGAISVGDAFTYNTELVGDPVGAASVTLSTLGMKLSDLTLAFSRTLRVSRSGLTVRPYPQTAWVASGSLQAYDIAEPTLDPGTFAIVLPGMTASVQSILTRGYKVYSDSQQYDLKPITELLIT